MSQARLGVAAPGSMVHCLGAEGLAFLEENFQPILADLVPVWQRLGVL